MSRGAPTLAAAALLLLGAWVRPPGLGEVTQIRSYDHGDYTRVVIELSRKASWEVHEISNPPRLYVDIDGTWIEKSERAEREFIDSLPLRALRGGQNQLERARVVLELERSGVRTRTFHLLSPFRIVIDIFADGAPLPGGGPPPPNTAFDARKVQRIVLDPGHGGTPERLCRQLHPR